MPLVRDAVRGAIAGAVGTLAMDLLWYRRQQRDGSEQTFLEWELGSPESYEEAGPPAQVARKLAAAVGVDLPDPTAKVALNVVHWATGVGYAAVLQPVVARRRNVAATALATGVGAFATSYATLGALGIYQPIWEYDADTLRDDLTAHLVFGAGSALAYRALSISASRRRRAGGR